MLAPARIAHPHAGFLERFVNRSGVDTKLLADRDEGVAVGVELLRLVQNVWCHLELVRRFYARTLEMLHDGAAMDSELASELIRGLTATVLIDQLYLFRRTQAPVHAVVL